MTPFSNPELFRTAREVELTASEAEIREMQNLSSEAEMEKEEGMKGRRVAKVQRTSNATKMTLSSAEKFHKKQIRRFLLSLVFWSFSFAIFEVLLSTDEVEEEEDESERTKRLRK